MAIRHIVIIEIDEKAANDDVERAFEQVRALLSAIPGVKNLDIGPNQHPTPQKRVYGATMEFDNMDILRAYVQHENHAAALTVLSPYDIGRTNIQMAL